MEIPVFENGEQVGTLQVSRAGLYTLFSARLPPAAGADTPVAPPDTVLSRLWLLNKNGNAASLGLLAPSASGRALSRRLTRLECSRLPSAPVKALVLPNGEKPKHFENGEERRPQPFPAGDRKTDSQSRIPHSKYDWRLLPDGSLIDPKRRLLALPWGGEKLPPGARKKVLNGKEYWLFRY